MKKRLMDCLLTGILFASCMMPCLQVQTAVYAEETDTTFAESLKTRREDWFTFVTAEQVVIPNQVGAVTSYDLQGLAVTCENTETVIETGIGSYSVAWSDGAWGNGGIPADGCRMQPITGFAEHYGKSGEYVSGSEYVTYSISNELTSAEPPVYLLTLPLVLMKNEAGTYWSVDYTPFINAILADEHLTLLGAVYGTRTSARIYDYSQRECAVFQLEDGITDIPKELETYGKIERYYGEYYLLRRTDDAEIDGYEDSLAFCEQLTQIKGVKAASPFGTTPEDISGNVTGFGIELLPYYAAGEIGDLNGDGKVTVSDAIPPCITLINTGTERLYYDENTGHVYDPGGNLMKSTTESVQTALYEGVKYTVDLDAKQVFAPDGTVSELLTDVLAQYLTYTPVAAHYFTKVDANIMHGEDTAEKLKAYRDAVPLNYEFSDRIEDFQCSISVACNPGRSIVLSYRTDGGETKGLFFEENCVEGYCAQNYLEKGDINLSGSVTVADAVLLARVLAEDSTVKVSELSGRFLDVDSNGKTEADDLTFLLRQLAGIKE